MHMEKPDLVPDSMALQPYTPLAHLLTSHNPFLRRPPLYKLGAIFHFGYSLPP